MGDLIPDEIVRAAMAEPSLRGRVILSSKRREPLVYDGKVVGFVTPHQAKIGWRIGPIYVLPGYRKRGLVVAYYNSHPEKTFVAFVPAGNRESLAMHKRAGFVPWRKAKDGQWMKREPLK